jgi:RsiW-degrading membrane proteinase PrsW (M82 family)
MCIAGLFLSLFAALIPTAIYGWFVNWLDRHEKEPWWLLALVFLWGAVPAFMMAVVAQLILDIPTTWVLADDELALELIGGSVWAPITEELAKGLGVILVLLLARREMDSILDGIVYGAMAGSGFAFTENILYFGGALDQQGWGGWAVVVLLRTIPFGLNHALFTGLTGAGIGAAYLSTRPLSQRLAGPAVGLGGGMFLHSVHNLGASLASASCLTICFSFFVDWSGVLMLGALVALVWRQERVWMAEYLPGEVTEELYQTITTPRSWRRVRWQALLNGETDRWRQLGHIRQATIELAFKKERLARRGPDPNSQKDIDRYRQRLAELEATPSNH